MPDTLEGGEDGVREEGSAGGSGRRPGTTWWRQVAVEEHVSTGGPVQLITKLQLPDWGTTNRPSNIGGTSVHTILT